MSLYLEELLERVAAHRRVRDEAMRRARLAHAHGDRRSATLIVGVARAASRWALQVQRYADELADVEAWAGPSVAHLLAARQKGRLQ